MKKHLPGTTYRFYYGSSSKIASPNHTFFSRFQNSGNSGINTDLKLQNSGILKCFFVYYKFGHEISFCVFRKKSVFSQIFIIPEFRKCFRNKKGMIESNRVVLFHNKERRISTIKKEIQKNNSTVQVRCNSQEYDRPLKDMSHTLTNEHRMSFKEPLHRG